MINAEDVEKRRSELKTLLKNKVKIQLDASDIENLIFKEISDPISDEKHKVIALHFELIKKMDLTGISFDNVDVSSIDFSNTFGVQINPQLVYKKDLSFTDLTGAEIIGPFKGVNLEGTLCNGLFLKYNLTETPAPILKLRFKYDDWKRNK